MHRSHWDLEVHAKDVQQRRSAEAAWYRLVDEAMSARAEVVNPFNLGIARFVEMVKGWLTSGSRRSIAKDAGAGPASNFQAPDMLEPLPREPRLRPGRQAQPYADMVVIARGTRAESAEQPSVVRDC